MSTRFIVQKVSSETKQPRGLNASKLKTKEGKKMNIP
jgi:hypothetical protein